VDEATRTSGPEVEGQQEKRSPDEIRADIEETREDLGDTVEALAAKTDVKGQAKAKVESVKQKVGGATDGSVKEAATSNPVPTAAIAAFVGGLLVGILIARR
jgi:ElaB/YqjD/DUF883 family membrane-anchored ribosome-binding protein